MTCENHQHIACQADCNNQSAWQGQGIVIGHIDSGVDTTVPAFKTAIEGFRLFDYKGLYQKEAALTDLNGHGTMTAGLLVGRPTQTWKGGVAQRAQLLVAVAIESGYRINRILSALIWMLEEPVRIVNLSVGFPEWNPIFRPVIQELARKNVLVVAAIGNGGAGQYHSPGAYPEVLSVGAADNTGKVAPFSGSLNNHQVCLKPDVLGLHATPAIGRGGKLLLEGTGTSGATAIVSGIAARLMSQFPDATALQVAAALKLTASSLMPDQKHRSKGGLIQPLKASQFLEDCPTLEPHSFGELDFFRDTELYRQMQNTPPEKYITVILYIKNKGHINEYISKTILHPDFICSICVDENLGYIVAATLKSQLSHWWEDRNILMISRAG